LFNNFNCLYPLSEMGCFFQIPLHEHGGIHPALSQDSSVCQRYPQLGRHGIKEESSMSPERFRDQSLYPDLSCPLLSSYVFLLHKVCSHHSIHINTFGSFNARNVKLIP
jgi:hypothetical protein